jgi:outer membrane protein assembly factor BamB
VAGARIDSAPTVSEGRVLFGSHDGWVYCLRAVDGTLAWRFRAAPSEVRISAFGQLESLWPVLGSVLVHDDVAYVSAGRSSYLDGGMHLYGLEVTTGRVIHHRHLEGPWPDISEQTSGPYGMIGARPDLFSYKGSYLSMGPQQYELDLTDHRVFAPDGTGNSFQSEAHLMASSGFLDDTWHDRTFWVHARLWPGRNAFSGAHQAPKSGQIIVFDESTTYAIKAFTQRHFMSPMHVPGEGYELVADANDNEPGARFNRTAPPRWSVNVPIRARGLLLAGETLFLAGCRDVVAEDDPAAVYEGRTEALLWAVSADDGKKLAELELDAPPVNDGMSAAGGKVFVSSTDGTVTCLAGQEQTAAR